LIAPLLGNVPMSFIVHLCLVTSVEKMVRTATSTLSAVPRRIVKSVLDGLIDSLMYKLRTSGVRRDLGDRKSVV